MNKNFLLQDLELLSAVQSLVVSYGTTGYNGSLSIEDRRCLLQLLIDFRDDYLHFFGLSLSDLNRLLKK